MENRFRVTRPTFCCSLYATRDGRLNAVAGQLQRQAEDNADNAQVGVWTVGSSVESTPGADHQ